MSTTQLNDAVIDFIAGGAAGGASVVVGHPLDTVKVRLQIFGAEKYASSAACFRDMIKTEGVSSLFRGLSSPLFSTAIINSVLFTAYTYVLNKIATYKYHDNNIINLHNATYNHDDKTIIINSSNNNHITNIDRFIAGGIAAIPQSFILCPTDFLKIKLQQDTTQYKGIMDCLIKCYKIGGVTSLFQGQLATILRDSPALASYFCSYHYLNEKLKQYINNEIYTAFIAGAAAGAISWIVAYPIDVAKSTIQGLPSNSLKKDKSIIYILNNLYKNYGIQRLYRGLGIALIRSFPVNAVVFPVYETVKSYLEKINVNNK